MGLSLFLLGGWIQRCCLWFELPECAWRKDGTEKRLNRSRECLAGIQTTVILIPIADKDNFYFFS